MQVELTIKFHMSWARYKLNLLLKVVKLLKSIKLAITNIKLAIKPLAIT